MIAALKQTAERFPQRIAYRIREDKITYGDLVCKIRECESSLSDSLPLVICGDKCIVVLVTMLACTSKGIPYANLSPCLPEERKAQILDTMGECMLFDASTGKTEHIEGKRTPLPENCVYVMFTSGSTGRPKGVPITKENLRSFSTWIRSLSPLDSLPPCAVMNQAPFHFDLSIADLYYALGNGHTLIGADQGQREDPSLWLCALKESGAKLCVVTPTFLRMCLLIRSFCQEEFPRLSCFYFCGERLDKTLVEKLWYRFPQAQILNAYGPTEATSAVSAARITREDLLSDVPLPVGDINHLATEVKIYNGQIALCGNSVFPGYLSHEPSPFIEIEGKRAYLTGDLGFIQNQKLYCTGRMDTQIKYAGYRIELGDIEENLKSIHGVLDAAVVAVRDASGAVKRIRAHTVLSPDLTLSALKERLKEKLPWYMIPQIQQVDQLPKNDNAKIDRKRILP